MSYNALGGITKTKQYAHHVSVEKLRLLVNIRSDSIEKDFLVKVQHDNTRTTVGHACYLDVFCERSWTAANDSDALISVGGQCR